MNDRLHRVLDGELPRESLSLEEQRELREAEALFSSVLNSVPTSPLPDLGPAVLSTLLPYPSTARKSPPAWSRLRDWLWSPRPVALQWRPAYAFAVVALVFLGISLREQPVAAQQVLIQFRLDAPQARNVALAGNFTGWQPTHQLTRTANGVWTVVVPLQEGVHKYAFVVDGETWQADPLAQSVSDGFGGENSQIAVLSPDIIKES